VILLDVLEHLLSFCRVTSLGHILENGKPDTKHVTYLDADGSDEPYFVALQLPQVFRYNIIFWIA